MRLLILIFTFIICYSCKKQDENQIDRKNSDSALLESVEVDSIKINSLLEQEVPNYIKRIEETELLIPFNYSVDFSIRNSVFKWDLCDLKINSDSPDYKHYNFENNIPFKGYIGDDGKLHIVKSNDSTAVTLEKFKEMHSENYKKIYYSDKESVIFKTNKDAIAVLFFKYLNAEKAYSIFYNENDAIGFDATEEQLLNLAIYQLRLAKNLYKKYNNIDLLAWKHFKNALTLLDKKVFKDVFKEISNSMDTLSTNTVYTQKLYGNHQLISVINLDVEGLKLWSAINKIPEDKSVDFEKIYDTDLSDQIAFLRSRDNFIQIEFKDDQALILKKIYSKSEYSDYAVFIKTRINKKEVLMFTGGMMNYGKINSKEMAFFYMNLFKNYKEF